MKNLKTFSDFNSHVTENDLAIDTVVTTTNDPITSDVDTIINSLETLANELSEDIEQDDDIDEGAGDFIKSWFISKKAAKAQKKINKIKMNSADLDFAAMNAEGDKKKVLMDKSDAVKQQAIELQNLVDDKFAGKGKMVDARMQKEKIKGQLEIIKRTSGMEDDPGKKSDLRTKMGELNNKYAEEQQAIKDLEDKNKEAIDAERKRLQKDQESSQSEVSDSLVTRANALGLNELASEIESKLDWQIIEGTVLRAKYEKVIAKAEADMVLNESRYQINSVKDAFTRLM
ncbi:hypothetical protein N8Z10_00155 [bacterium]|nr:hypothetical protein [bacterium]